MNTMSARAWAAAVPSGKVVLALVVLGLACSALAMALFFFLIAEAGPSRATVITYLNPAVAVTLGVTLLGEHVGAGAVAGLLLILAGSWLSTGGRIPPGLPARLRPSRRAAAPARRAPLAAGPGRAAFPVTEWVGRLPPPTGTSG